MATDIWLYPVRAFDNPSDVRLLDPTVVYPSAASGSSTSRTLASALVTETNARIIRPITFVALSFDDGALYVHDWIGVQNWGGHTWAGVGDFGGVDVIEEGEQVSPFGITLTLSGITPQIASEALTQNYAGRACQLYLGALNVNGALVATPDLIWSGTMDVMNITNGSEAKIRLACESDLIALRRVSGLLYTDAAARKLAPASTFFKYVPQMIEAKIRWGGDTVNFSSGTVVWPGFGFVFPL